MIATYERMKKPAGEWQDEPDKLQWVDEKSGLDCLIVRNKSCFNLCGYVGVPEGHPLYKKGYSECSLPTAKPRGAKKGDGDPFVKGGTRMPDRWVKKMQEKLVCEDDYCDHSPESMLDVHGGITFSSVCQDDEDGVCHIAEFGANEPVWWFGFDCAHSGDLVPSFMKMGLSFMENDIYKNCGYVIEQTEKLAKQLEKING